MKNITNRQRAIDLLIEWGAMPQSTADVYLDVKNRPTFATQFLTDQHQNPWTPRPYQIQSLQSHATRKVHCDGRDVGKTAEIIIIAAWASLCCPNTQMLIATQCENHLYPLMHQIARLFETNPRFRPAIAELKRTPSWHIRFTNGFTLWARIAGPRGINFQGMHVDWQIIDEAQELTDTAWAELFQALNGNGTRWVYGVPNGLRNTFYKLTQDQKAEQHNWPSTLNPQFSREKDAELARLYGGKRSPGYLHRVLGQHGEPEHAVFDLDDYLACVDDTLEFLNIELTESDPFDPPFNIPQAHYYLGCDLGYARDPSEFVIYKAEEPHLINTLRLHLRGVNYHRQQEIITQLDHAYNFRAIGIDAGNNGRAIAHALIANPHLTHKIHPIEFNATLPPSHCYPTPPPPARARNHSQETRSVAQQVVSEVPARPNQPTSTPKRETRSVTQQAVRKVPARPNQPTSTPKRETRSVSEVPTPRSQPPHPTPSSSSSSPTNPHHRYQWLINPQPIWAIINTPPPYRAAPNPYAGHPAFRRPIKEFMTELLIRRMHERTIIFPRLPDRELQYANHTYRLNAFARILYNKGDDHIIDADRCALYAHHLETNSLTEYFT